MSFQMNRPQFIPEEQMRLQDLHRWLTLEGSSITLGSFAFIVPYGIVFLILKWGAVLFTPYLIWQLYKCKRYTWLIGFLIFVAVPGIFSIFLSQGGFSTVSGFLLGVLPLVTFYIYTWTLRYAVGEWLEEIRWIRLERAKQRRGYYHNR